MTRSIDTVSSETVQTIPNALLVFDGDCGFCTTVVTWLHAKLPLPPTSVPYQWADLEDLGLTVEEAAERVWLVTTESRGGHHQGGHQYGGHLAVAAILRQQPSREWRFLGFLLITFPFSVVASIGYSLIARFRHRLPGGTPACRMSE